VVYRGHTFHKTGHLDQLIQGYSFGVHPDTPLFVERKRYFTLPKGLVSHHAFVNAWRIVYKQFPEIQLRQTSPKMLLISSALMDRE
jgi:hypothetical protein